MYFCRAVNFFVACNFCMFNRTTGAELQVLDKDLAVAVFDVSGDNYVNISFVLSTHTCTYHPQWFRVKVATSTQDRRFPFCTILFQNLTCSVTDHSKECHCVHTDQRLAWVYRRVSPEEKLQILEWTDAQAFATPKEKIIVFNFLNQGMVNLFSSVLYRRVSEFLSRRIFSVPMDF